MAGVLYRALALHGGKRAHADMEVGPLQRLADDSTDFVPNDMLSDRRNTFVKLAVLDGRPVVLKRIASQKNRRPAREPDLLAAAAHDHVVRLFQREETADQRHVILAIERLTPSYGGERMPNLASGPYCREKGLTVERVFSAVSGGIGKALHHLHGKGIAHADIKMRNTGFQHTGDHLVFKLLDFGSAVRVDDSLYVENDNNAFVKMIMSVLTWDVLAPRNTTKALSMRDRFTPALYDDEGLREVFPWTVGTRAIPFCASAGRDALEAIANEERTACAPPVSAPADHK
jgi:serine/threonine protein kinase